MNFNDIIASVKLLFCCIAVLMSQICIAQTNEWGQGIGGNHYDICYDLISDKDGNIYSCGFFSHTVDMDGGPDTFNLITTGLNDGFIRKTDAAGHLIWAKPIIGDSSVTCVALALDQEGNLYVTGNFNLRADFDPGPDSSFLTAKGLYDVFLMKLDTGGQLLWVRQFGGTGSKGEGLCLAISASGAIYLGGEFDKTVDFDPGTGVSELTSNIGTGYIVKLDPDGDLVWARKASNNYSRVMSIALDHSGGIIDGGVFENVAWFGPQTPQFILPSVGSSDVFIQRMDTSGNYLWAKGIGGNWIETLGQLKLDPADNIILSGSFSNTADFDPGPETFAMQTMFNNDGNLFLAKLDPSGNFVWAKQIGNTQISYQYGLALDSLANIYATGYYIGTVDFDPGPGVFELNDLSQGNGSAFVLKTDFQGNFIWARNVQHQSSGRAVALGPDNRITVAGKFQTTVQLGNNPNLVFPSHGLFDIFYWQFSAQDGLNFHGNVFYDANENNIRDPSEYGISGALLATGNGNVFANTNQNGDYYLFDNIGHDTLRVISLPWDSLTVVPAFVVPDSTHLVFDFAVHGKVGGNVCIAVVERTAFRPGFSTEVSIQVTNVGLVGLDSIPIELKIIKPTAPQPLEFLVANPVPVSQTADEFHWITGPLAVNQKQEIRVQLRTPADVPPGTSVVISAGATLDNDIFPTNNGSRIQTSVVASMDPNDKQVTPTFVLPAAVDTTILRYVVRFQNTGTYPADFVIVRDTLSADLDLSMLKILAASHPYTWRLYGNRVLEFRFDHINLPDSTANEPESHGFVAFSLQTKDGLPIGTTVSNRAGIYFDFNQPVMTPQAVLTVTDVSKVLESGAVTWFDFGLSPNPVVAFSPVAVDFPEDFYGVTKVTVSDALGRVVQQISPQKGEKRIYLNGLSPGSYFVQVRTGGLTGGKVLMVE